MMPENVSLKAYLTEQFQSGNRDPEIFKAKIVEDNGSRYFVSKLVSGLLVGAFNINEPAHLCFESNGHIQTVVWQGESRAKIGPYYPLSHVEMAATFKRNVEKALEWHREVCKH